MCLFTHLFLALTKFVPLSDIAYEGVSLLAVIRINAFMIKSVSNKYAISKCTARVAKHVNKQRYCFIRDCPRPCLVKNGPAKSVPILSKALNGKVNVDAGRGAIFLLMGLVRNFRRHSGQFSTTVLTINCLFTIQNCERSSVNRFSVPVP